MILSGPRVPCLPLRTLAEVGGGGALCLTWVTATAELGPSTGLGAGPRPTGGPLVPVPLPGHPGLGLTPLLLAGPDPDPQLCAGGPARPCHQAPEERPGPPAGPLLLPGQSYTENTPRFPGSGGLKTSFKHLLKIHNSPESWRYIIHRNINHYIMRINT